MSRLNRWIPRLIIGVAGVHAIDAAATYTDEYRDILRAGVVGTVDGHRDREAATWFLVAAPAVAALGFASRWSVEHTGRIPPAVPTALIGLGALITLLAPGPGGMSVIALGAAGIAAGRRTGRTTRRPGHRTASRMTRPRREVGGVTCSG